MNHLNGRKEEIIKMINNEFSERKAFLIKQLETNEDSETYLSNLQREKKEHNEVFLAVEHYFRRV